MPYLGDVNAQTGFIKMPEPSKSALAADDCLRAAARMHQKLSELSVRIELEDDPGIEPDPPLAVDVFLAAMPKRKNAPKVVHCPKQLGRQKATENIACYVYARIEQAFVSAGNLPGKDRLGQKAKLEDLRAWIDAQLLNPERLIDPYFIQRTTNLFRKGLMEDRRSHRIGTLVEIDSTSPTSRAALLQLKFWVESDLNDDFLLRKGRPTKYQKIMFAAEIANLWNALTGKKIAKGPQTNFAKFVRACWDSGFEERSVDPSFKRILRDHIAEDTDADPCGKCEACKKSEPCKRTRYYGTLMSPAMHS